MNTDLRSMLVGQLSIEEGSYLHLDYWDVFHLDTPATEDELKMAQTQLEELNEIVYT